MVLLFAENTEAAWCHWFLGTLGIHCKGKKYKAVEYYTEFSV